MKKLGIIVVLGVVFSAVQVFAQGGGQAAISGTVVDQTGAAISGAKVSVTQKGTSALRSTTTSATGSFNVPSLPPQLTPSRCRRQGSNRTQPT